MSLPIASSSFSLSPPPILFSDVLIKEKITGKRKQALDNRAYAMTKIKEYVKAKEGKDQLWKDWETFRVEQNLPQGLNARKAKRKFNKIEASKTQNDISIIENFIQNNTRDGKIDWIKWSDDDSRKTIKTFYAFKQYYYQNKKTHVKKLWNECNQLIFCKFLDWKIKKQQVLDDKFRPSWKTFIENNGIDTITDDMAKNYYDNNRDFIVFIWDAFKHNPDLHAKFENEYNESKFSAIPVSNEIPEPHEIIEKAPVKILSIKDLLNPIPDEPPSKKRKISEDNFN